MWSSGQGAIISAGLLMAGHTEAGAWQCLMVPDGGQPATRHAGHSEPVSDESHGYCPVCSLTGCASPSLAAINPSLTAFVPKWSTEQLSFADHRALVFTQNQRPQARAPPFSV